MTTRSASTPLQRRRLLVVGGIVLLLAAYAVAAYGGVLSESRVVWLTDIAWAVFSLAAAVRSLVSALRQPSRRGRLAWSCLATAAFLWFLGMVYLIRGQLVDPDFQPYPTLANYFFVAFAPYFTAGVLFLPARESSAPPPWMRLANLGLITCAVSTGLLIVLYEPLLRSAESTAVLLFSMVDPAAFSIAALFTLTCLWLRDLGRAQQIGWLLFAAIALHAASDLLYFFDILGPAEGLRIEILWLLAFALQYLAAFEQDHAPELSPRAAAWSGQRHRELFHAILPSALLLGMLVLAFAFSQNLSRQMLLVGTPPLALFAVILGLRAGWMHRRETQLLARLKSSDERSRHILAASPAVVFVCPARLGYAASYVSDNVPEVLGIEGEPYPWSSRVHPEDRDKVGSDFDRVLREGSTVSEYRLLDDSDTYRWVHRTLRLLRDAEGRPLEIIGTLIDTSKSKSLELQVLQGQRLEALGKLAGGIAHDFNNVLTTILGHAELSLLDEATPAAARESLEEIEAAGRRAADLTGQLLAFSRQQPLQLHALDVNQTVRDMVGMLQRLIGEDITMEVVERRPSVAIQSDAGYLEPVVMNLVVNARDAMPEGGTLRLEIDEVLLEESSLGLEESIRPGLYAVISVSDTGVGMSDAVRTRVFEPFFSTKPRGEGTGLGLATVYGIVRQHRGFVDVSSRPGEGSRFRVFLPRTDERPSSRAATADGARILGGTESLLVVDDDQAVAGLLGSTLRSAGYQVRLAFSGEDALALARQPDFALDLLLTDVVLPGINGRQLAAAVRDDRPEVRVVYMSGYTDDSELLRELQEAGTPLERKPLSLARLTHTIRTTLDEAPLTQRPHGHASRSGFLTER